MCRSTFRLEGLTTSPDQLGTRILEIEFDFPTDNLTFFTSDGEERRIPLAAGGISDFHAAVLAALADLDVTVTVTVDGSPSEMPNFVPFAQDHSERPYDANAARDFWRALIQTTRVFDDFRTAFLGKASPTHFFWGSFNLASPRHPGGVPGLPDAVTVEAYSDQEASLGFWPGSDAYPHAAFYAYAWPAPVGDAKARVAPDAAPTTRRWVSLSCNMTRSAPRRIPTLLRLPPRSDLATADFGSENLRPKHDHADAGPGRRDDAQQADDCRDRAACPEVRDECVLMIDQPGHRHHAGTANRRVSTCRF